MNLPCSMDHNTITGTRFGRIRENLTVANLLVMMCTLMFHINLLVKSNIKNIMKAIMEV